MEWLVRSSLLDVNQVRIVVEVTKVCKVFAMKGSFSTIIVAWFLVLVFGFGFLEGFSHQIDDSVDYASDVDCVQSYGLLMWRELTCAPIFLLQGFLQ